MSLRARMGVAAGAAVALAVVAVAIAAYEGTRSNLYSELDTSLRGIASQWMDRPPPAGEQEQSRRSSAIFPLVGRSSGSGRSSAASGGGASALTPARPANGAGALTPGATNRLPGDCDDGLGINSPQAQPLGGATGVVELITPRGSLCKAAAKPPIPYGASARAIARRSATGAARPGGGEYFADVRVAGKPARVFVTGLRGYGALMVALPLAGVQRTLHDQLLLLVAIGAAGVALAALLGFLVARTGLSPVGRFTRQAETIAAHPDRVEHERLEISGSDELARLGRTFNAMLDALEESIAAQRNLVADASHELRTPIATLRANLQLLRDEALLTPEDREALRADMIEELDELTQLVGDVVELARGAKPPAEPGELRLDQAVEEALERARRRAAGIRFQAALEPTLICADGARVSRAITNLLDNAAKWSPPGGLVEVSLAAGVLSVRDHGPGFRAEDLPFVFDRFHRARDARSKPGSGLGLAIVRQAAEAHGGFVTAANAPGGGALMRISFGTVLEAGETADAAETLSSS